MLYNCVQVCLYLDHRPLACSSLCCRPCALHLGTHETSALYYRTSSIRSPFSCRLSPYAVLGVAHTFD
jgi:hypothetical protein